ncbi:unnamed protein product [marine sediment metagenome]|uniref:Uncharacterized protein n=1 Tax=marine sediment metagenome TaxID=412755 RepID=X1A7M3_9ZZZZ
MAYKIPNLTRFISANPALADVPIGFVKGIPLTPRLALAMLQRGEAVTEVVAVLAAAGMDPIQQDWKLVEDYYIKLLQLPSSPPTIYVIGEEMTLSEALSHIQQRDLIGQQLLRSYQGLTREMARRMR